MSYVTPDCWVMLKITSKDITVYKILAGFYGGYTQSDSWKLNSGCASVKEDDDYFIFYGYSGSQYRCHKSFYRLSGITADILENFKKGAGRTIDGISIEVIPEDTDFLKITYEQEV